MALTLLGTLCACSTWKVFTFRSHPDSFVAAQDMKVTVGRVASLPLTQRDWCSIPTNNGIIGVALAPLLSGIFSLVTGLASDELSAYYDAKIKEFTQTYSRTLNVPALFDRNQDLLAECFIVQLRSKDPNGTDDFAFAARLLSSKPEFKPTGFYLVPTYYRFNKSAARTGTDGKVDVTVDISFSVLDGSGSNTVNGGKMALRGIVLPVEGQVAVGHREVADPAKNVQADDTNLGSNAQTPIFPIKTGTVATDCHNDAGCNGYAAAAVTVTVTETGTGSPNYGTAKTETSDAAKSLSDTISNLIKADTAKAK